MACLFCLKILSKRKDHEVLEEKVTTENGGEYTLKISLKNPDKNLEAFNCLCSLLNIKWMSSSEGDDDEEDSPQFDKRRPLPLCRRCQQGYQEMYQLYQQIKEMEVLMMKRAKLIRGTIQDSETGGLRLTCEKLNGFRQMVMLASPIPSPDKVDVGVPQPSHVKLEAYSSDEEEEEQSQDYFLTPELKPNGVEDCSEDEDHENDQDLDVDFPLTSFAIPKAPQRRSHRIKAGQNKNQRSITDKRIIIIKKLGKSGVGVGVTTNSTLTSRNKSRKQCTSTSTTSQKGSGAPSLSSSSSSSPARLMSSSSSSFEDPSSLSTTAPCPTPTPKKKVKRDRQSKLEQVTDSTPRLPHIDCFTCCYCGIRMKTTGGLANHKKYHEPRKCGCPLCPKKFASDYQVKRHLKGVHKSEQAPVTTAPPPPAPENEAEEESSVQQLANFPEFQIY